MGTRIFRAAAGDGCRDSFPPASVLEHFRKVIDDAWHHPSPAHALAKRQLDFFCGHIDAMPTLKDYVSVSVVAAHYSALNPTTAGHAVSFNTALGLYLSLLNAEVRNAPHAAEFRGASVALTFDRARHDANILRFVTDEPVLAKVMMREPTRTR